MFVQNKDRWTELRRRCAEKESTSQARNSAQGLKLQAKTVADFKICKTSEANDKATKAAFFKIRSVCSLSGVKAEQPRKRALPGQCHNCQSYGHSSRHCYHSARCVKCLGDHGTAQCTRNKDTDGPPACVLCKQKGHTANYLGCPRAPKDPLHPRRPCDAAPSACARSLGYIQLRPSGGWTA
ncbi:Nucleic-acid-binding protein from transposon X-element [Eumeta japonica]|uniref:Nucleic-acid-binding protein from transposon X-element n=1 Tax=Eumeta variegata TaxID=151549 RepID=A0A4C1UIA4_EUMVA|nr:Nucleic-acid-binding protein from transposon X-element [Eumeta japonica]